MPVQLLDPLAGESRSGTIAQPPLKPVPVVGGDVHRCIERESAAVVPLFHVPAIVLVQYPASHAGPQNAATDPGLHHRGIVRIHLVDGVEAYPALRVGLEYAVDDAHMKVGMRVERGAEAMDEGYRAGACIRPRTRAVRTQMTRDLVEQDA